MPLSFSEEQESKQSSHTAAWIWFISCYCMCCHSITRCMPFAFTVKMSQNSALRRLFFKSWLNWLMRKTLFHYHSFHLLSICHHVKPEGFFIGESNVSLSDYQCLNSYAILNMWSHRSVAHFVLCKWLTDACAWVYFTAKSQLVWHTAETNLSALSALSIWLKMSVWIKTALTGYVESHP